MKQKYEKNQKGFTLIELLVVISVIGFLSSFTLVVVTSTRASARDAKRIQEFRSLQSALEIYYEDNGRFPRAASSCCTVTTAEPQWDSWFAPQLAQYMRVTSLKPSYYGYVSDYRANGICLNVNGNSIRIGNDGYMMYVALEKNNDLEQNDNGIMPNAYEIVGGDVVKGGC